MENMKFEIKEKNGLFSLLIGGEIFLKSENLGEIVDKIEHYAKKMFLKEEKKGGGVKNALRNAVDNFTG